LYAGYAEILAVVGSRRAGKVGDVRMVHVGKNSQNSSVVTAVIVNIGPREVISGKIKIITKPYVKKFLFFLIYKFSRDG